MYDDIIYDTLANATINAINGDFIESCNNFIEVSRKLSVYIAVSKGEIKDEWEKLRKCVDKCINYLGDLANRSLPQSVSAPVQDIGGDSQLQKDFSIGSIPDVTFDDVIGLDDVKSAIYHKIIYPQKHKDLYGLFDKKIGGGILLYGLPGTGKTLIAQATAREIEAKFFAVKCSDLGSKWFGETEKNLKSLFEQARQSKRAIIFFDEVEAYAGKRHDDTTTERIVAEFLTQLQGFTKESKNALLFMAATNRPWDIDSAFLRPGRFDDKIYVPLPDKKARQAIIQKKLSVIPCESTIDTALLAKTTEGYNCADIDYLCEKSKEIAIDKILGNKRKQRILLEKDLLEALNTVTSSVVEADKIKMQNWKI